MVGAPDRRHRPNQAGNLEHFYARFLFPLAVKRPPGDGGGDDLDAFVVLEFPHLTAPKVEGPWASDGGSGANGPCHCGKTGVLAKFFREGHGLIISKA